MTIYVIDDPDEANAFGKKTYEIDETGETVIGTSFSSNKPEDETWIVAEAENVKFIANIAQPEMPQI